MRRDAQRYVDLSVAYSGICLNETNNGLESRLLAVLREIHEVSGLGIRECEEMIAGEGRGVGDGGGDVEMTD